MTDHGRTSNGDLEHNFEVLKEFMNVGNPVNYSKNTTDEVITSVQHC